MELLSQSSCICFGVAGLVMHQLGSYLAVALYVCLGLLGYHLAELMLPPESSREFLVSLLLIILGFVFVSCGKERNPSRKNCGEAESQNVEKKAQDSPVDAFFPSRSAMRGPLWVPRAGSDARDPSVWDLAHFWLSPEGCLIQVSDDTTEERVGTLSASADGDSAVADTSCEEYAGVSSACLGIDSRLIIGPRLRGTKLPHGSCARDHAFIVFVEVDESDDRSEATDDDKSVLFAAPTSRERNAWLSALANSCDLQSVGQSPTISHNGKIRIPTELEEVDLHDLLVGRSGDVSPRVRADDALPGGMRRRKDA
eukprot:TRINITY_DN34908_c0_g1_i1.p1 TRINITY_DN34908_c0_g1~~TRINITY_DN34908_c0_g1_i1.p1  ORF type:complete len:312 (+),score=38.49 TRINITY_DN34908_c0_g1_i1:50-985(+)